MFHPQFKFKNTEWNLIIKKEAKVFICQIFKKKILYRQHKKIKQLRTFIQNNITANFLLI